MLIKTTITDKHSQNRTSIPAAKHIVIIFIAVITVAPSAELLHVRVVKLTANVSQMETFVAGLRQRSVDNSNVYFQEKWDQIVLLV